MRGGVNGGESIAMSGVPPDGGPPFSMASPCTPTKCDGIPPENTPPS